ncbi:MAG TPA: oxidoreductase [Alteromonas macleodii]|nr:SDR family oxidoreductase [Alteromonas macleodii]HBA58153.1 oxidoreductase [Alteromonas macleodii]|tara:strand:+ start:951 stop:1817 length:867 start_codon:yes stop_codon:yes gene_type:complete
MNIAFVTGANSGMGFETITMLAGKKNFIVIAGYRDEARSKSLLELASAKDNVHAIQCDVNNIESVNEAFAFIKSKFNKLDILINNAGYGYVSLIEYCEDQKVFDQFNTNVFGPIRCIRRAIPLMRNAGFGHVINITSFLGKMGLPYLSVYNASKFALEGLTESLRYELAHLNIKVSSIAPGLFKTDFANKGAVVQASSNEATEMYQSNGADFINNVVNSINSGSNPALVAQCIEHLLSDKTNIASHIVGDDAVGLLERKSELNSCEFERYVASAFEIEYPTNVAFTFQ